MIQNNQLPKCTHSPTHKKSHSNLRRVFVTAKTSTYVIYQKWCWKWIWILQLAQHSTAAVEDCQDDLECIPLNTAYILYLCHLPLKQQLAARNTCVSYSVFNIWFQKGKSIHSGFTKSMKNNNDIAERDSSDNYLDYEDTVSHKKPYSLPQWSLWRAEGFWCLDLEAERLEKFFWDIQEAYVLRTVHDDKHLLFTLSSLTARISAGCWFRKATNLWPKISKIVCVFTGMFLCSHCGLSRFQEYNRTIAMFDYIKETFIVK